MTAILPENWNRLSALVDKVLDAPPDQRRVVLDDLTSGDPDLGDQLRQLVDDCERSTPVLDRPAVEMFADLFRETKEPEITGVLGDRYAIVREAGHGGMARVYLARDTKHQRDVAVKVIRSDIAASLGKERFLQEISVVGRLRHPNIVPLYDSGERDGLLYFVMPYEEGPSLRRRLAQLPRLESGERVNILRDVARALSYAHERGLVHRDIKPDNVLLSGGAAVVADFGIAKAVSAAQVTPSDGVVTQAGARMGTPAYMAPEQAVGDPTTDHRADIYSFGCLAYELYAGVPPFTGSTTHEVIAAHVGSAPPSIIEAAPAVPRSIGAMIMQCLSKLPQDRPQSAQEILRALETIDGPVAEPLKSDSRRMRLAAFAVLVISIVLAGAAYRFLRMDESAASVSSELTVAVFPLATSGDSLQRELAYGLSDEIATALVNVPGVRVMSRRAVAASHESGQLDPEKMGRELGAQFLVTGSLRESGGRLTVLANLIQAHDGAMLWADHFNLAVENLGGIRDVIARSVGDSLRRKAGLPGLPLSIGKPSRVVAEEPYRLYVLAQRALNLRGQSIQASADMFRRATELDTLYAEAFSGLSLALALTPYFSTVSTKQVAPDAISAARRALQLDPTLAQPHVALGIVHSQAYRWDSAQAELETAVRLRNAGDVEPLVQYGRYLVFRGRTREALAQFVTARKTEPGSALVSSWVAYAYYLQGQQDSAIVENKRAFQADSANMTTLALGSVILLKFGDVARARDYVRRMNRYHHLTFHVLAAIGDTAEAYGRLRELERQNTPPWHIAGSRAFAALGARDTIEAIRAFERATDDQHIWPTQEAISDPIFDPVRSHPRFQQLLKRVGLN